ncbi:hypothetical protein [Vibrio bivalvicida]|uniref:Uncharacterized protein n=1 Tax=Vibrio bivalvicida TaxID=1276888 RepID=A0ABV4MDQ8_9VIBR
MKLFASIATTTLITGSIWGLLLVQPAVAEDVNTAKKPTAPAVDEKPNNYLRGITQTIALQGVPNLWDKFYANIDETNPLPQTVDHIVVLYQAFNADFSEAKVTIGYPTTAGAIASDLTKLPDIADAKLLPSDGNHNADELTKAWQKIDFAKKPYAVVETHYLNQHGLPESSQMSVYYKQ